MRDEDRTRDVGRHLLGPHAVGQRVVVRRLVPGETGPTGGPAFTDLLGDLVAWPEPDTPAEERYAVVLGADGSRTAIPLAQIISGKPVPPRPSPRHRVSARDAEQHALAMWPGIEHERLGEWTLRTDPAPVGRLLKRANSCLALGSPGVPLPEAADRVRDFYSARDREPLAQVELGSEVDETLRALGWSDVPGGQAELWIAPVAQVRRARRRVLASRPARVEQAEPWLEEAGDRVRAGLGPPAEPTASGRAAVDRDWVGIHGLEVLVTKRRRGLASLVVDRLLEWAAERGATTAWLHVESDNAAAQGLYSTLGFGHHHTVRYLRAPA